MRTAKVAAKVLRDERELAQPLSLCRTLCSLEEPVLFGCVLSPLDDLGRGEKKKKRERSSTLFV